MNATKSGLYATAVAVPGDNLDAVKLSIEGWLSSFALTSFAAAQLARRAAQAAAQLDRADRLREKALREVLELRVGESEANKGLVHAQEAREALAGLAALAGEIVGPVSRDAAAKLVPAVRRAVQGALELELPPAVGYPLAAAAGALEDECVDDLPTEVFAALAVASQGAMEAIDLVLPHLRLAVENERDQQSELVLVADDKRLRDIDRVRGRLLKELDALLRAMRSLKDLEGGSASTPAAPPVPVVVEFKSIGSAVR